MRTWEDNITRDELEIIPGVMDQEKIRMLSINTYLRHMWDFVENDINEYSQAVLEHMEDVMMMNYITFIKITEGKCPESDEISAYLNDRENIRAREYLTYLCYHASKENWPDIERYLQDQEDWTAI